MKTTLIILIIAFFTAGGSVASAQTVLPLTTKEFKEKIWNYDSTKVWSYKGDKPVILDLYATWCPPCKKLSPILEQIQKEYGDKLQIYKIDTDKEPELTALFNATSIPLMVFIPKNSKPTVAAGLRPKEQIEQIIADKLEVKK